MHFTERPPNFVRFVTERPPPRVFDAICDRKTPTSEVLGGTRTSLSYVSAPPPGKLSDDFSGFVDTCGTGKRNRSGALVLWNGRIGSYFPFRVDNTCATYDL